MSRYPAMSQAPLRYDRSLLVGAPAVTREDRQAGYDINALERGTYDPQPAMTAPTMQPMAPVGANPFQDGNYERTISPSPVPHPSKRPWWKRKRWTALALIIFIGIICGVVAGVVSARNSRNSTLFSDSQNAASAPEASNPSIGSSSPVQSPTPIIDASTASRSTFTAPAASPTIPRGGENEGTTIMFGGPTTLPPGVSLPTATAQDPPLPGHSDEIPLICYVMPTSRQCAPYFESDPPRM